MRFSKVSFSFGPNDSVTFSVLNRAPSEPFLVASIDGLNPPPIDIAVGNRIVEGGLYRGRRPQNREIVTRVRLQPDYRAGQTYEALRDRLYGLLTPKLSSMVTFSLLDENNKILVSTTGQIKTFEATLFSKTPDVQIVMTCFSPYLAGQLYTMANPESQPKDPVKIYNPGNAPSGFTCRITFQSPVPAVVFSKARFGDVIRFFYPCEAGDTVSIDTKTGSVTAYHYRGSRVINLLRYASAATKWLQMDGGDNELYVSTGTDVTEPHDFTKNFVLREFTFTPRYWGA